MGSNELPDGGKSLSGDDGKSPGKITLLLKDIRDGGDNAKTAENALFDAVYGELRKIASRQLGKERRNQSLTATGLVHEVYLRMAGVNCLFNNRGQFFGIYAKVMHRILIERARERMALKRPSSRVQVELDDAEADSHADEFIEVNDLLEQLAKIDRKAKEVFYLKYFGGLTIKECVEELTNRATSGEEAITVNAKTDAAKAKELERDCNYAKAYLKRHLKRTQSP